MPLLEEIREFLERKLSSDAYRRTRYVLWHGRYYWPNLAASRFTRRRPRVRGFPGGHNSGLVKQLSNVNVLAPTEMCRVMTRHGSDKGKGRHNYTTVYSALLSRLRNEPLRVIEIGVGTTSPEFAATMGKHGIPGASLRGWRELFPRALVYGADIDRAILFEEHRIKTFYCDQLDKVSIRELWSQPELSGGMDIIIDDGLHTLAGNTSFLDASIDQLRPGGIYVIEDVWHETIETWHTRLETVYSQRFPDHEFAFVELPNPANHYDNNLVIIRKEKADSATRTSPSEHHVEHES